MEIKRKEVKIKLLCIDDGRITDIVVNKANVLIKGRIYTAKAELVVYGEVFYVLEGIGVIRSKKRFKVIKPLEEKRIELGL